ncbi:MAG: DEAD/DEAH box helicase [Faecousia sp.]
MNPFREVTLGEEIFSEIEANEYLNELYENILHNYSQRLFRLPNICDAEVDVDHALRFADLLSKSVGTHNSDKHKIWAQEIVALLHYIYPEDARVTYYMGSVLSNTSNYRGMSMITPDFKETTLFDRLYSEFNMDYLTIPADPEYRFFPSQKAVYDNFDRQYFSYSAPTSMGKSFMMRMFIKKQVMDGKKHNYAIIVPTKALINEVSSKIIQDLKGMLQEYDYRVVTSSGDIALTTPHNYIFVLTPERLLYLLISDKDLRLDYLFIDEAHKISSKDKRSAFYYKVVDMLSWRKPSPHIIFASPNIPNPEVFLELIPNAEIAIDDRLASSYAPVSQMKYMVDFVERQARYYNPITKSFTFLTKLKEKATLQTVVSYVGADAQNIVYCSSTNNAVQFARDYAELHKPCDIPELNALARDIRNEVHTEYYLADLVEKGIAYHIGYLPADIRMRLEDYYRRGLIKIIFCTSTLIEGVNLPADNLFITSYKSGLSTFSEVDFKNLMGRVGRIEYNLYGNVFIMRLEEDMKKDNFEKLIDAEVPRQRLSLVSELTGPQKERIIKSLCAGNVEFEKYPSGQAEDAYDLMRKFALILVRDITNGRNSRVVREFTEFLDEGTVSTIRAQFATKTIKPDDDINISVDQTENLEAAIASGLEYPDFDPDEGADYRKTVDFMERLLRIFKWDIYEHGTLGRVNKHGEHGQLAWYTVIMLQWMRGYGLSNILVQAIRDKRLKHRDVRVSFLEWEPYDGTTRHNNFIIAETLEAIEDVVLFRIANYFLRFSEEYKRQHGGISHFKNDWYEFVEYGTCNELRITLQRSGFSREASSYIRQNASEYIIWVDDEPKVKLSILECKNDMVKHEAEEIRYNVPELFAE